MPERCRRVVQPAKQQQYASQQAALNIRESVKPRHATRCCFHCGAKDKRDIAAAISQLCVGLTQARAGTQCNNTRPLPFRFHTVTRPVQRIDLDAQTQQEHHDHIRDVSWFYQRGARRAENEAAYEAEQSQWHVLSR